MENNTIVSFLIDYFKEKTSHKNPITNQSIDILLQENMKTKELGQANVRGLIHYIRVNFSIKNEEGEEGWICGTSDGYYLSYDPIHIMNHLERFDSKIHKMMLVRKKGYKILENKVYYRQSKLQFE